jgi:hypothetical protein
MARKIKVDFTGVESFIKCEEGQHVAVLKSIEEKSSSNGNEMLSAVFEVAVGESRGAKIYDNFVLTQKSLWKLKSYLDAIGIKSEGKLQIDIDNLVGKRCIIQVIHEDYNGQTKSRIDAYKKLAQAKTEEPKEEEIDESEEEEVMPAPKKVEPKKKEEPKKKPAPKLVETKEEIDEDDDWGNDDEWEED